MNPINSLERVPWDVVATNVRLPRIIWERAKLESIRTRRTLVEIVSSAVEEYLENLNKNRETVKEL